MKKEYTKPLLFAESFVMTEHIAGSCKTDEGFNSNGDGPTYTGGTVGCEGYRIEGGATTIFNTFPSPCDKPTYAANWQEAGVQCYNLFNEIGLQGFFSS